MTSTPEAASTEDLGDRGQLVIKERVVTKIATTTALQVPGVVRQSGGLLRFPRRELPSADVTIGANAVAINLYVCVEWPCRLDVLDSRLQQDVNEQVEFMTGLPVHSLHVIVADTTRVTHNSGVDDDTVQAHTATVLTHEPRATPIAAPVASLVAVLALALSVISARELLVEADSYSGAPWIRNTFEWLGRLHWSEWLVPAAVAAVVLGVLFVVCGVLPRKRTHRGIRSRESSETVVWLRPTDLARRASNRALTVPHIIDADATLGRKRLTVRATADGQSGQETDAETAVRSAVEGDLDLLGDATTLRVKVTK